MGGDWFARTHLDDLAAEARDARDAAYRDPHPLNCNQPCCIDAADWDEPNLDRRTP